MKYLKRYSESVDHESVSVIEDMLLELRDLDFQTDCQFINDIVIVNVSKEKEFQWNEISQVISYITNYMKEEGYQIADFTSKGDVESPVENPDDYEIKKPSRRNEIPFVKFSTVIDPVDWNTIKKWSFNISFTKPGSQWMKYLKANEELSPSTYLSAADKLKKMGHIRRPEVLTAYAKEIQEREKNARKKRVFEEAKKLGQFQLKLESRGEVKFANFYLSLLFNDSYYHEALSEWIDGERSNFWIGIMQGLHPVSEEDSQALEWYFGDSISGYINSYNGIIWLQDIYICLSSGSYKSEEGQKLPMTPTGQLSIEGSEFNEVYFANRREAIKFKNLIVDLFEGDIEYVQSNGKDFKEQLLETLCENDERPVELSEFEELIDKLRVTRLNHLYRD